MYLCEVRFKNHPISKLEHFIDKQSLILPKLLYMNKDPSYHMTRKEKMLGVVSDQFALIQSWLQV